ncbi:uncharacterized protein VP01_896g4 [Puccinia sorghi]|uniref:DUF6589 domain-containing protein n=1 Tax=Puccinia sorghi TaxID=27349 RepID=A0A0L6U7Z9_9BASI|nr:uncharacterized protein VP01_896g4 [Puccinia sorghi]
MRKAPTLKFMWISHIACVMFQYVAKPDQPAKSISPYPPYIDLISHTCLYIRMLKLMEASDNSAEGIGQVINSIAQQADLSTEEFYSHLILMDRDLATVCHFNSLCSLCSPNKVI